MSRVKSICLLLLGLGLRADVAPARAGENAADKRPQREGLEKRREELPKLSSAAREAKSKEWRETNSGPTRAEREKRREQLKNMSPEEREAKRVELRTRLEKRIAELRGKQTNATITSAELRELERREQILQRFGREKEGAARLSIPAGREPAAPAPPAK